MKRSSVFHPATLGAFLALLLILATFLYFQVRETTIDEPPDISPSTHATWYSIYFTDPQGDGAATLRGGPDEALVQAIDTAQYSVDVAIYHLDLWSVRDALLRAHKRGVRVRVVTESNYILEPEIGALDLAGVPVLGDRREHLMHHKFIVIDELEVWSGSMNFTIRGAYRNNNNLLRIRSDRVAKNFTREFEEMFVEDRFGALSLEDTPFPRLEINDAVIEVFFSPDDGVQSKLLEIIAHAERTIDFMAFTLTSDEIATALLARADAGVRVRGLLERSQAGAAGGEFTRLDEAGIEILLDENPGSMHHKVLIVDGDTLVTGSYNFTRSAEQQNDENVLVVFHRGVAQKYLLEFERLFDAAQP